MSRSALSERAVTGPPVGLMALGGFAVGCGMRLLDPLLPMIAREFGVGLGAVAPLIGAFALAYGIGQFAGPLGDRFGKMRVAISALGVYALTVIATGLMGELQLLIALRAVSGLAASVIIPLMMAEIGDAVPYEQRQATLGRFARGMILATMIAGPISGVIADVAGWRMSFLLLGTLAACIAVLVARGISWRAPADGAARSTRASFFLLFSRPAARRVMLAALLDGAFLFGGAFPFVPSMLIERHGLSTAGAGLAVAGFGLGSLLYTRLAPVLVRRFTERQLVVGGGVVLCAGLGVIALAGGWWPVVVVQPLLGLGFFLLHGVLQARATEMMPEARGTAVAGFAMALFAGQSLGAVVFGTLIGWAGFGPVFAISGVGTLLLALATAAWVLKAK
jgi:predicted MFS family arabinose efflux permease